MRIRLSGKWIIGRRITDLTRDKDDDEAREHRDESCEWRKGRSAQSQSPDATELRVMLARCEQMVVTMVLESKRASERAHIHRPDLHTHEPNTGCHERQNYAGQLDRAAILKDAGGKFNTAGA